MIRLWLQFASAMALALAAVAPTASVSPPRLDISQIVGLDQSLGSPGFIWVLIKHNAKGSWVSQSFDHGVTTHRIKLNIGFNF